MAELPRFLILTVMTVFVGLCSHSVFALSLNAPKSKAPQDKLADGLAVSYYLYEIFNHVDEFAHRSPEDGEKGPPLLVVNYHTGYDNVLTSPTDDGVGAHISGYIHLAKSGTYQFAFESNDGVRLHLNGEFVLEDPDVHADQFSEVVNVEVANAGWYPITIWYFEKRNTSTLRLYWREPGAAPDSDMEIVPGKALRHVP